MSHIHFPDGVIPTPWWLMGFALTIIILAISIYKTKQVATQKKIPLMGVLGALMLVGMSIPLGGLPFHVNLATLTGIIIGPWLGFITVFVVTVFLALIGHGGITVIGINTLTIGFETIFGAFLFRGLRRIIKYLPFTAALTTIATLVLSTVFVILVVAVTTQVNLFELVKPEPNLKVKTGSKIALSPTSSELLPDIKPVKNIARYQLAAVSQKQNPTQTSISRFAILISIIASIGISIETVITTLMISFINKVKPDILEN